MTLLRMVVVLVVGLALMLLVVVLRSETARLHFETSRDERRIDVLRHQLREAELEQARRRNPMVMRQQLNEAMQEWMEAPPQAPRRGKP
ncbi:MAG: hypothetical protein IPM13_02025 [Phycisphaerales bacterium]|nr:hypothetical protein [Phycisphaerales bacterium]